MNLSSHITKLALAVGLDIKDILARITAIDGGTVQVVRVIGADIRDLRTASSMLAVNAATRLIQTQRIIAKQVLNEGMK